MKETVIVPHQSLLFLKHDGDTVTIVQEDADKPGGEQVVEVRGREHLDRLIFALRQCRESYG